MAPSVLGESRRFRTSVSIEPSDATATCVDGTKSASIARASTPANINSVRRPGATVPAAARDWDVPCGTNIGFPSLDFETGFARYGAGRATYAALQCQRKRPASARECPVGPWYQ